jgi:hypothetical protein
VRYFLCVIFILLTISNLIGQADAMKHRVDSLPPRFYILPEVKRDGVTLPEIEIKEVTVMARPKAARRNEYRKYEKYERLVYNVRKVYPYALLVRMKLDEINYQLESIRDEKERRGYLKNVEKQVFADYEDDIRNMTITQGRILIKLIDRETQNTSYALIRDYRGKISAVFWQGIARIFGSNLKDEYDPFGDDMMIESIITDIETGRL